MTVTVGTVTGEKTSTGYTFRFPVTARETGGVAATVTAVGMQFMNGNAVIGTVNRTDNLPFTAITGNGTGAANWTITHDPATAYATRLTVTITFTDTAGAQTATGSADVPPLPQTPVTFNLCGLAREG